MPRDGGPPRPPLAPRVAGGQAGPGRGRTFSPPAGRLAGSRRLPLRSAGAWRGASSPHAAGRPRARRGAPDGPRRPALSAIVDQLSTGLDPLH